jgi:nitrous-oxide reductase
LEENIMKKMVIAVVLFSVILGACSGGSGPAETLVAEGLPADAAAVAADRGLTPDDIYAAVKTYMPSGQTDPYIMFASGGQSGQMLVIGVPSMRILKMIAVFTPESWQGYGYGGSSDAVLAEGFMPDGTEIKWGDTHHPGLSETAGEYDGQFVFINDKANARLAVIDLRDFETKQIVKNPTAINDHGGTFVTPNTEYVVEGPQYAAPIGWEYAPLDQYQEAYRGVITF